jgi:hypothetical protein
MIASKDNETNETQVTNPIDAVDEYDDWESSDNETDDDLYNTAGLVKPTDQMIVIDKAAWDSFVEFAMKSSLSIRKVKSMNELLAYEEVNLRNLEGLPLMWYSSDCSYD